MSEYLSCKDSGDNRKFQSCGEIESMHEFEFYEEMKNHCRE